MEFWAAAKGRAHQRQAGPAEARRSLLGRLPNRLPPGRDRRPGHRPQPAMRSRRVTLRDGSKVLIRQVQPADAPLLAEGFARLSAHSRRMRFLTIRDELSPAELRYLTNVDHHDHEALGAVDRTDGRGVGIARYIRDPVDPQTAEIAVTVIDSWQGRGLGTQLLAQLTDRAHSAGIRRFTALVADDNAAIARLLCEAGASLVSRGPGTEEYEIMLPPGQEHSIDWWLGSWNNVIATAWR